ncbi:unnamed protein product [Spirodela intermedia]|uniref:Biotin carboxyl carrier protein of acetyl-CoA carboxylase n=1 Tax=Spirodela intermedia TaxID=51605 RepID=A0A7I8KEE2_SPIIN|nr:unnamed protein product [Spirodela intermedia]
MASTTISAATAAGASVVPSSSSSSRTRQWGSHSRAINFCVVSKPKLRMVSSTVSRLNFGAGRSCSVVTNSLQREVIDSRQHCQPVTGAASVALYVLVVLYYGLYLLCSKVADGSSHDSVATERKHDMPAQLNADAIERFAKEEISPPTPVEAVTEFMTQVSNLVKLVDSRDIIELQLKQQDCELIIRKKEAMPHQPAPAPVIMMQSHGISPVTHSQSVSPPPAAPPSSSPAGALPAPSTPAAATATSVKPSHPRIKSPMAGTFYGSPGPGQPAFVKVGDKVHKGQVLCIIEAMKLMNEIEADLAGTVVEILLDDAKPVSIDQPLFVIQP